MTIPKNEKKRRERSVPRGEEENRGGVEREEDEMGEEQEEERVGRREGGRSRRWR